MIKQIIYQIFKPLIWIKHVCKPDYKTQLICDNPTQEEVLQGKMLIVGNSEYKKWLYFLCPCGCKEVVMLSLSPNKRPQWTVKIPKNNRPTVYPSIRRLDGCFSHFWIENGIVKWCSDTGKKGVI